MATMKGKPRNGKITRRRFLQFSATVGAFAALGGPDAAILKSLAGQNRPKEPLVPAGPLAGRAEGPWRRLFLDSTVVEKQQGVAQVFHAAQKHSANPVIRADRPWEGRSAITGPYVYGTVLSEQGKLRLWYQVLMRGNHVGYAESNDGIHWAKPEVGIIEFQGSKANNLVVSAFDRAATGGECHNPSVIRCPAGGKNQYALYGFDPHAGHPRVAFSSDGIHWRYVPQTERRPLFTSSDVVNFFYDPYQKRYTATWKTSNRRGRAVGVAWSLDGLAWSKPMEGPVFVSDDLDPDATQIYGMPAFPYQGLYVGQPWIYHARYFKAGAYSASKMLEAQEDSARTMDVQLAWSWDLINWTRPASRSPFIRLGDPGEWDDGMIVSARAPVLVGDKLHFYYGGCDNVHDSKEAHAAIGLATLRPDGLCSLEAREAEGWLITRRETFEQPAVTINARTHSGGYVIAEILDRHDRVLPGFARTECIPFAGDSLNAVVNWKSKHFSTRFSKDCKLRFWLKNANLFSYFPAGGPPT